MKALAYALLVAGSAAALVGVANAQPSGGAPRAVLYDQPDFQGRSITVVDGSPDLRQWGFAARAMSAKFEGDWTVCDQPDLDGWCATVQGDVPDLSETGLRRIMSLSEGRTDEVAARDDEDQDARPGDEDRSFKIPHPPVPPPPPTDDAQAGDGSADAAEPSPIVAPPAKPAAPAMNQVAMAVPPSPPALGAPPAPGAPPAATTQAIAYVAPPTAAPPTAAPGPATTVAQSVQANEGRSAVFFGNPTRAGADITVDLQGPANLFCHEQNLGSAVYFDTDGHVLRDVLCRRP
jgi:beta/gamma crystallin